jgi:hypothetical protein
LAATLAQFGCDEKDKQISISQHSFLATGNKVKKMGVLGKLKRQTSRIFPDTNLVNLLFSQVGYLRRFGRLANVKNPRCFNEHLMRLKCSDEMRRPLRTFVTDRELLKLYVRGRLGEGHTPKTLAILRHPEEVDAYHFPTTFVAKPAHGSHGVIIKRGDEVSAKDRKTMKRWLGDNYFHRGREPQYRFIEPKVIVEEFVGDQLRVPLDIKVYCFQGTARFIEVDFDRFGDLRRDLYDIKGNPLEIEFLFPRSARPMPYRNLLEEIISCSEILATGFSFVGVDLFVVDGRIFVIELNHTPENCNAAFNPPEGGILLGQYFGISSELEDDQTASRRGRRRQST